MFVVTLFRSKTRSMRAMFHLAFHHTGEGRDGLLNVNLGAAFRLNAIGKTLGHCGMPAIDAAAVSTPTAVVLVDIHIIAAYLSCYAFVESKMCATARRVRGCKMW